MARKEYAGAAPQATLTSSMSAGSPGNGQTFTVDSGTGYPTGSTGDFVLKVDAGTPSEEKILCSERSGNTFTVATSGRGFDGTAAVSHGGGVTTGTVNHCLDAESLTDFGGHVYDTGRDDHTQYLLTASAAELIRDTIASALVAGSNITITPSDPLNTITISSSASGSLDNIWLPAKAFGIALNTPTNALIASGYGTGWSFPDASQNGIASNIIVPTGWDTVTLDMWWVNMASSSGDVLWRVFLDDDADGTALGGGSTPGALAAIAAPTTAAVLKKSTIATGFDVTAGRLFNIAIDRNGNGAGDTLANDAAIVGVNIRKAS